LVASLGGDLCVASEEGTGTAFFFELDLPIAMTIDQALPS
jgi:chemotaxis protein histidine kinase CheA